MLLALCLAALLQSPQVPEANSISRRPALPALTVKAPGMPEYGLHISSPQGQFVFTNLRYTPLNPTGAATLYRMTGPAGKGPYRLGVELRFWYDSYSFNESDPQRIRTYTFPRFEILKTLESSAAKAAGLDESWYILKVDGQEFGWDSDALVAYLTNRPTVEVLAYKSKGWAAKQERTFQVQLRKLDIPMGPAEEVLVQEQVEALQPYLKDSGPWSDLITLRSALARFTPLPVDLPGKRMWAVRGAKNPHPVSGEQADLIALEFWGEDPASGPRQHHPDALWAENEGGMRGGKALQVEDHWYRIQDVAVDTASGRLLKLVLQPWAVDVPGLLAGAGQAQHLGPHAAIAQREAFEQMANEALIDWKIRTLPGLLPTQGLGASEDLVVRLEKGLLRLDLEGKGIRARLDAQARAEAERKAALELPGKGGGTVPAATPPASESERLADLLEQRKAILMAILGSAKQALSNLRR